MLDRLSGLFFGIFLPSLAVYCAYLMRLAWKRGHASQRWPTTEGTILESRVQLEGDHYSAKLLYAYLVQGEVITGNVLTYRGVNSDRETAEVLAQKYPAAAKVFVYYDPAESANSVLEPGVDKHSYFAGSLVIVVLFCVGIGLLIFTLLR